MDINIKFLEKTDRNSYWKYYIVIMQDGNYINCDLWRDWEEALEWILRAIEFFK